MDAINIEEVSETAHGAEYEVGALKDEVERIEDRLTAVTREFEDMIGKLQHTVDVICAQLDEMKRITPGRIEAIEENLDALNALAEKAS